MKSYTVLASDKTNLIRIVHFLLRIGFQVIAFFIFFKVRYLVAIIVNFNYKWARQLFSGHYKVISDWFIFLEYFSDWWFNFIMATRLYYFSKEDTKTIAIKFLKW